MSQRRAAITPLGTYVPERVVTNADLEKIVDTTDEWIRTRTGIQERHYVEPGTPHQRARGAGGRSEALRAARHRGRRDRPDHRRHRHPGHALPRHRLPRPGEARGEAGLGLRHLRRLLRLRLRPDHRGPVRRTRHAQEGAGDRRRRDDLDPRLQGPHHLRAVRRRRGRGAARAGRGRHRDPRLRPRGGRLGRLLPEHARRRQPAARRRTRPSTRSCTTSTRRASTSSSTPCASSRTAARQILRATASPAATWTCFVAHQANIRIIDAAQQRLGLPDSKVVKNIHQYGNTTAATIPLALGTALDERRLKRGDLRADGRGRRGLHRRHAALRWSGSELGLS